MRLPVAATPPGKGRRGVEGVELDQVLGGLNGRVRHPKPRRRDTHMPNATSSIGCRIDALPPPRRHDGLFLQNVLTLCSRATRRRGASQPQPTWAMSRVPGNFRQNFCFRRPVAQLSKKLSRKSDKGQSSARPPVGLKFERGSTTERACERGGVPPRATLRSAR